MPAELSPTQQDAVMTSTGPLLVLAGAGSGKTRVVTYRIAELIRRGTAPERILAVTFTNKAASEMRERAAARLRQKGKARPEISTFHSLCVRILRRHIQQLGYPQQFAIYDRGDQDSLARGALREMNVPGESLRPGELLWFIGQWKTHGISPAAAEGSVETDKEHLAALAYRRYQAALKAAGAVDFDDLLLLVVELFENHDKSRRAEAARFDHVMIDEYQDTNTSQYRIVKALAAPHRNLCVVGDDDQAIYGWRGAEVTHILRFKIDWPEAKIVRLEENYRSTPQILDMANTLITHNRERHDKVLRPARRSGAAVRVLQMQDEADEARQVVADIRRRLEAGQIRLSDVAILFRTNEQPRTFEMELRRVEMPYVLIGGMSFYDRKEVRDLLAYLKVFVNPNDETSLLRIINTPPRGIAQPAVKALLAAAVSRGDSLWDVLATAGSVQGVTRTAAEATAKFRKLVERYSARFRQPDRAAALRDLLAELRYREDLDRVYKEAADRESRWAAVEQVVSSLGGYEQDQADMSLKRYLDDLALTGREDENDKDAKLARNAVALMTLHSAKGLEFPHVYLVGLEEGLLPHHRAVTEGGKAIDEERRLCYVGVTRARDQLTLTMALSRQKWGKSRPTQPSRYLYEMTGQADHPNAQAARQGQPTRSDQGSSAQRASKPNSPKSPKSTGRAKAPPASASPARRKRTSVRRSE